MAHPQRYRKYDKRRVAKRLQKHWKVTYPEALEACNDMEKEPGFKQDLRSKVLEGKESWDALFELCVETWEFDEY